MGKKWFKNKNKSKLEKPKKVRAAEGYEELVRENPDFEVYYKAQKIVPNEEWDKFISCLREDLPAAFRLTGSKSHARFLLKIVQDKFFIPMQMLSEGGQSEDNVLPKSLRPVCLPWYPDELGWQLNLTRKDIRRSETYWKLHQFLISETETGNISRQEAVSMIPPLLLDVKHHHKVLDMCAAPGSKTAQIIEFLHSSNDSAAVIPSGIVVANDSDNKRCYMLTHQAKRLQSPTLIITNHDAAFMPNILYTRKDGSVGPMKFDRILCDVPCSGDGTLRKNYDVWSKWNAANGANLHGLQLRIARRGLEMLAIGGRMVYSTCSLNPLENEAVINRLLEEAGGSVTLLDVSSSLPGLKFVPGVQEWVIMNRELKCFSSPEEIPEQNTNLLHKHLFPPSEAARSRHHLERCIRILPHHQNTGGFFVAVLQKLKPYPGEKVYIESTGGAVEEAVPKEIELTQRIKPPPKKRRCRGFKEEPFYYMSRDNPVWKTIFSFYGFKESTVDPTLFLTRCQDGKGKNLYFTNSLVKDTVLKNENRIKIINTGVKVLVRCDNKGSSCDFRLAQDGSQVLFPLFDKRKLNVEKDDTISMLINEDSEMPPQICNLSQSLQKQCENLECGSVTFTYRMEDKDITDCPLEITLVGWKAKRSVRCYIVKNERLHYLRLLGGNTSTFEHNKFEEQRALELNEKNSECKEETEKDNSCMDQNKCEEKSTINIGSESRKKEEELPDIKISSCCEDEAAFITKPVGDRS